MSSIVKTDAVVLRAIRYRESSKIVTFYTRSFGKLSGIVKGALRSKRAYGPALEPMAVVSIVLYKKEGREVQTVTQCDLLQGHPHIYEDLERMEMGMALVELAEMVSHAEEENAALYDLLSGSLSALDGAGKNYSTVLYNFEFHLARLLGFEPSFGTCAVCGARGARAFDIGRGGMLCDSCAAASAAEGEHLRLSGDVQAALRWIAGRGCNFTGLTEPTFTPAVREGLEQFLWAYLRYHAAGMRTLKSRRVFSRLAQKP